MTQDRRSYLRNVSALVASVVGASAAASAGDTPPEWDSETVYTGGDRVVYDGYIWEAEWWTKDTTPSESANVWTKIGPVDGGGGGGELPPAWSAEATYTGGDRVTYEGYIWEAEWWTRGDEPTVEANVWTQVEPVEDPDEPAGPTASFTVGDRYVEPGTAVEFDASGSEGDVSSYEWAFGDDATATGEVVSHAYENEGEYTVELTVTDGSGASDTATDTLTVDENAAGDEFKVVGYYPSWKGNEDYGYYPEDVPFDKVTDVLYAFLDVQPDGTVTIPDSEVDHESLLQSFADLKQGPAADTRLKLSIGGWALSPGFEDAADDPSGRQQFADTAVALMREYDFDGIDIDWEHPGPNRGVCECGSSEGPANHVKLLEAVRERLDEAEAEDDRTYYLSVANGGSDWNAALINHREVEQVVDDIYMMAYDFTGVWHETAGLNAPIYGTPDDYPPSGDAQQYTLETTLEIWKNQGYWVDWMEWEDHGEPVEDPGSLVMGLPFYGRGCIVEDGIWDSFSLPDWQQGDPEHQNDVIPPGTWNDLLGPDQANTGAYDYGDLAANYEGADGWEKQVNEQGQVPYLWNEYEGVFISYDDPASIEEKVQLAKDEGLGGVMFWELSQDYDETLIDTINEAKP
ncbi:glycosyl hydrolase family 18 protein [Haloarchaeobius iranensis]|uniref:Chitinase, GH18 family n=1 Tax=Haloarchaeobius iranensis TaxID=996166 RepID=A0A1G9UWH7_9EURY|nr:glycosyl hydrolase family 18 protein [Haloarchaeobius iranensis]SDM64170.1 Chitinase, GH18 family [Haloarchaeobius iranensis]